MKINFQPYGDSAILINFKQKIDLVINQQVVQLAKKIEQVAFDWVQFCIPAYCSLTVGFDFKKIQYEDAVLKMQSLILSLKTEVQQPILKEKTTRILNIPVCYNDEFALDLNALSQEKQLSTQEIIELHTAKTYHVFMLGFLPGFPYLGILPKELSYQRKATPRTKVPARSVALAGLQTGIYPSDAPGGWQIIGKTPLPIFLTDVKNPFLFQAGDQVNFHPISKHDFQKIEHDIAHQTFNWQSIYG